jgi:hypothetical protein
MANLAIRWCEKSLKKGVKHAWCSAESCVFLFRSCTNVGEHAKALELSEKTLTLRQATLGAEHPHTLMSMANLAAR